MKKENEVKLVTDTPPAEQKPPAVKSKPVKKEKKKKEAPPSDGITLPVLVEVTYTSSAVILAVLFTTVVGVSMLTGAKLLDIVIRTSTAVLVIGGLLILISRQISADVFNAAMMQKKEEEEKQQHEKTPQEQDQPEALQPSREPFESTQEMDDSEKFGNLQSFEEMESSMSSEAQ